MKRHLAVALISAALTVGAVAQAPATKSAAKAPAKKSPVATKAAEPTPQAASTSVPSEATVDAFLKRMFGYNENLTFKVSSVKPTDAAGISEAVAVVNTPQGQQLLRFFITSDGEHAIMGDMVPFGADPFVKARTALKKQAFGPSKGPKDAALEIVEFADLECPACKNALPAVEKLQADFPQARFVFQSFPLEQLHPWATMAAQYLDCMAKQSDEAAWTFIDAVYAHQGEITQANLKDKLDKYVGLANQDPAKISACAASPETITRIRQSIQLAQDLNVTSTPTLFVNGRPVGVNPQDYEGLKAIVQYELSQAAAGK